MDLLTDVQFKTLKNYCKIDHDFDDDVLEQLISAAALEIARAIRIDAQPAEYIKEPRFLIALMKQVKEDYYQRGLTADGYRPMLSTTIIGIINQLRTELGDDTAENN